MVVGEMPEAVDFLVIGGGPGGYVAALEAARLGRNVVLVDDAGAEGLGGVCVRVGCIPSKALIELADHTHSMADWADRGAPAQSREGVDLGRFQGWKSEVVGGLNRGVQGLLKQAGVDVRQGRFRFTRRDQGALVAHPDVPPTHLQFKSCVVATGSQPMELKTLPFDGRRVVSSTEVLELTDLPGSVAMIGAGYIGMELGTALQKLGSAVTIVEAQERPLPTMDPRVGSALSRNAKNLGMSLLTGVTDLADDGEVLRVTVGEQVHELAVDLVVVAIGRTPNTSDLGLEVLGVEPDDRGLLTVGEDRLITSTVAAIGDITHGPALAHKAMAEATVAAGVLSGENRRFEPMAIPAVTFSDPEVAHTGMTVEQAQEEGVAVRQARFPMVASGRAQTLGDNQGYSEYLVGEESGIVLGATIVGPFASELIAQATFAIEMSAHVDDVAGTIHAHPTMSEVHQETALIARRTPIHVPMPSN